jgi:hypothetical protein
VTIKPKARRDGLISREIGPELVVYDTRTHAAHALDGVSARIWQRCDGSASIEDLAALIESAQDEESRREIATSALAQLEDAELLEGSTGLSWRKTAMVIGAAAVMVPVVDTIFLQSAAASCSNCIP